MNKMMNFFLKKYEDDNFFIKAKSKALFISNIILSITALAYATFALMIGPFILDVISFYLASFFLIISLIFIKFHHYEIASNITIITAIVSLTISSIDKPAFHLIYTLNFSLIFLLLLASLICFKLYQLFYSGVLGIIVLSLFFIFISIYTGKNEFDSNLAAFIPSCMILLLSVTIAIVLNNIFNKTMKALKEKTNEVTNKYEELNNIILSSKKGLEIGKRLIESTINTEKTLNNINTNLVSANQDMDELNIKMKDSEDANKKIIISTNDFKNLLDDQNASISEASASIEQMTASINKIADISIKKKEMINKLVFDSKNSEEKINQSEKIINDLSESSKNVLDVIKVIVNIAGQTNLLAMNAAIEAAHAGDMGKGFAVVADEIRTLSEETNKNTKKIKDAINININNINLTVDMTSELKNSFTNIINQIADVAFSIDEIINGMQGLSTATSQILISVSNILNSSSKGKDSIDNIVNLVANNDNGIKSVINFSYQLAIIVNDIVEKFNLIFSEIKLIKEIGFENVNQIEELGAKLEKI